MANLVSPGKFNRKLTYTQREERTRNLIADAPTHTVRQLEAKYNIGFTGVLYILKNAGVKAMNGRYSRKGAKPKWVKKKVRDKNATELKCTRCGTVKPVCEFYAVNMTCRQCAVDKAGEWAKRNPDRVKEAKRKYAEKNVELNLVRGREYRKNNPEKERIRSAIYRQNNKPKINKRQGEYIKRRLKTDIVFRIRLNLRRRLWRLVKGVGSVKGSSTESLIGIKYAEFIKYLESLWLPGMNWSNYSHNGWHIEHTIPCASFERMDEAEQRACFNYKNMRPMWSYDNYKKSDIVLDKETGQMVSMRTLKAMRKLVCPSV